jgi:hypothetical protein
MLYEDMDGELSSADDASHLCGNPFCIQSSANYCRISHSKQHPETLPGWAVCGADGTGRRRGSCPGQRCEPRVSPYHACKCAIPCIIQNAHLFFNVETKPELLFSQKVRSKSLSRCLLPASALKPSEAADPGEVRTVGLRDDVIPVVAGQGGLPHRWLASSALDMPGFAYPQP